MIDRSSVIYTSIFDYRKPQRSIIETWQTITTVRQHHQSKLSARQRLRTGSCQLLLAVKLSHVPNKVHALSYGFPQTGGGPAHFLASFQEVHFWSIKGVYFFQNANNLNFRLF